MRLLQAGRSWPGYFYPLLECRRTCIRLAMVAGGCSLAAWALRRLAAQGNAWQCDAMHTSAWYVLATHRDSPCITVYASSICVRLQATAGCLAYSWRVHVCTCLYMGRRHFMATHKACVADAKMRLRTRNEKDSGCGLAMISWLLDCRADDYGFASATVSMCCPQGSRITITYRHASSCIFLHDHDAIYAIMTHHVVRPLARPA